MSETRVEILETYADALWSDERVSEYGKKYRNSMLRRMRVLWVATGDLAHALSGGLLSGWADGFLNEAMSAEGDEYLMALKAFKEWESQA